LITISASELEEFTPADVDPRRKDTLTFVSWRNDATVSWASKSQG
jgi:hypothetical protein